MEWIDQHWPRFVLGVCLAVLAGCKREPPPAKVATSTAPSAQAEDEIQAPRGVDDLLRQTPRGQRTATIESKDPPKTPPFIPGSEEIGEWHRDTPAEVAEGEAVEAFFGSPKRWARIAPYHPKLVVRASFRWKAREDSKAEVELIEVAEPLDAVGMVLAHCRSTDPIKGGHITRTADEQGTHFYTWAGRYFAHVSTPVADEGVTENCRRLLQKIVFQIPTADPPAWLRLLMTEDWSPGRLAVTRSAKTLARDVEAEWPVPQPDKLDALLGLNGAATMGVAAYQVMAEEDEYEARHGPEADGSRQLQLGPEDCHQENHDERPSDGSKR